MKTSTKLIIAGIILFFIPFGGITQIFSVVCIIGAIVLIVIQGAMREKNEATPKQKQKQDTTPPWEQ